MELPPRARRILRTSGFNLHRGGTTSACAENTSCTPHPRDERRNYLRVRGEYHPRSLMTCHPRELPPRARRIQPPSLLLRTASGTTSACAENTGRHGVHYQQTRNYLRVRGEYGLQISEIPPHLELPPRARRIQVLLIGGDVPPGTTSACAENTLSRKRSPPDARNYLRVRGEYAQGFEYRHHHGELPPRARRIP